MKPQLIIWKAARREAAGSIHGWMDAGRPGQQRARWHRGFTWCRAPKFPLLLGSRAHQSLVAVTALLYLLGTDFWLPTVAWSCPFSGISIKQLIENVGQLFSFFILLTSHKLCVYIYIFYFFIIYFFFPPTKSTCWNCSFQSRLWMCVLFPSNGNMQTLRVFAWFTFNIWNLGKTQSTVKSPKSLYDRREEVIQSLKTLYFQLVTGITVAILKCNCLGFSPYTQPMH